MDRTVSPFIYYLDIEGTHNVYVVAKVPTAASAASAAASGPYSTGCFGLKFTKS